MKLTNMIKNLPSIALILIIGIGCKSEEKSANMNSYNMIQKSSSSEKHSKSYLPITVGWNLPDAIPVDQEFPLQIQIQSLKSLDSFAVKLYIPDFLEVKSGNRQHNFGNLTAGEIQTIDLVLKAQRMDQFHIGVNMSTLQDGKRQGMAKSIEIETIGYTKFIEEDRKIKQEVHFEPQRAKTEIIPNKR